MTREEIEKLWVGTYVNGALAFERVHKFAALVAAAEREACAKVCEEATASWTQYVYNEACMHCAAAIRARRKI